MLTGTDSRGLTRETTKLLTSFALELAGELLGRDLRQRLLLCLASVAHVSIVYHKELLKVIKDISQRAKKIL